MDFNLNEIKQFEKDLACIRWLIHECKTRTMDSNLFYELNYYVVRMKRWIKRGISDQLILLEVTDMINLIQNIIDSISEEDAKEFMQNKNCAVSLRELDKLKYYEGKSGFNGYVNFSRHKYTEKLEKKLEQHYNRLIYCFIFLPLLLVTALFIIILILSAQPFFAISSNFDVISRFIIYLFFSIWLISIAYVFLRYIIGILPYQIDAIISLYTGIYILQSDKNYLYYYNSKSDLIIQDRIKRNYYLLIYSDKLIDIAF